MKILFYCEKCGKGVPFKAENCPHCGRRFISAKCPSCKFEGKIILFRKGCPQCGYNGGPMPSSKKRKTAATFSQPTPILNGLIIALFALLGLVILYVLITG